MREKILKQFTQVPNHLYVKRKADEQISKIITDMLRPGYVSVARQMGKTNLLQHAQRNLQSSSQIITYIDVSSSTYISEQEYFRYVIDTILETNPEHLGEIEKKILLNRNHTNLSPAKEHQNELRSILKFFPGNIIIILDEVDSLIKYSFSDQIFAQIRSVYFMKNTFQELNHLSYILSGVIEPTKLIKSKENSPFNIAHKIYLDDFSYEEFRSFIIQSQLNVIEENVIDRIYYWTNGNPRMTYDLCSEIEEKYIIYGMINEDDVDIIIEKLYLSKFDQAPIDHIRDILTNNMNLRNALRDIRNNKIVSDEIKSQLYLYGIINSDFDNPKVKNLILDRSLSEEWLMSIERQSRGLYVYGLECISNRNYTEAIISLHKFIDEVSDSDDIFYAKYYLGVAYNDISEYEKSNEYLLPEPISSEASDLFIFFKQLNIIALNFIQLNDFDRAEEYLNRSIQNDTNNEEKIQALINLTAVYTSRGDTDKVISTSKIVLNILTDDKIKIKIKYKNNYQCIAYYNLGQAEAGQQNVTAALINYEKALDFAEDSYKPALLLRLYFQHENQLDKDRVLIEAIDAIVNKRLLLTERSIDNLIPFTKKELNNIFIFSYLSTSIKDNFDRLVKYVSQEIYKESIEETLVNIAVELAKVSISKPVKDLFLSIIVNSLNDDLLLICYRYLVLLERGLKQDYFSTFSKYYNLLLNSFSDGNLLELDVTLFINTILDLRVKGDYSRALRYSFTISKNIYFDQIVSQYDRLLIKFFLADLTYKLNRKPEAKEYALDCFTLLSELEENIVDFKQINKGDLSYIRGQIEFMAFGKSTSGLSVSPIRKQKISRNTIVTVKYNVGETVTGKYKLFERDLEIGNCILLD